MAFSLRASVSNLCNMDCVYCPRWTSMEDFSPHGLSAKGLSPGDYLKVFTTLVQSMDFSSVSITGGEPLINKGLIDIIKSIRPHVKQLEITTNGTMLTHARWQELAPYFDRVKISMDSIEPTEFQRMTGLKLADGLDKVQNAIKMVRDSGVDIAVNCVVMNSNLGEITGVIDWAKEQRVRLHLLDFYHTEERHHVWEREFVPLENVIPGLIQRYGKPEEEDRFGCKFLRVLTKDR